MAEEVWQRLGHATTLAYEPWPAYDDSLLVESTIEIPVQVNGKLRGKITVPAAADQGSVLARLFEGWAHQREGRLLQHLGDLKRHLAREIEAWL